MKILIQGGRLLDPATGLDEKADLALVNGVVTAIKSVASDFQPDTVIDATAENIKLGTANGFVFNDARSRALAVRITEACAQFREHALWRKIQRRGMLQDFSWADSAVRYEALYRSI